LITNLIEDNSAREKMQSALAKWHAPQAAEQIAETMLKVIARESEHAKTKSHCAKNNCGCGKEHRAELRAKTAA
jgi:hypothetical protein